MKFRVWLLSAAVVASTVVPVANAQHGTSVHPPDFVVMPHMNGRELSEELAGARPEAQVLFTSGYSEDVIAHRGVLHDGFRFMTKPYSFSTLAARVREALDG